MNCRLCNADVVQSTDNGNYLKRVNEFGVTGIWECSPSCGDNRDKEDAFINAITNAITDAEEIKSKSVDI
jgi:hypothetical protein